jgi:hypothetical protein
MKGINNKTDTSMGLRQNWQLFFVRYWGQNTGS